MTQRRGGSFAPPLTDEKLSAYAALADRAAAQVKEALGVLLTLARVHKQHPTSTAPGTPHSSGRGVVVPLAVAVADAVDPHLPWDSELEMYAGLFEKLCPQKDKELRDAAHHLLWYAKELSIGREPITNDRL